MKKIKRLAIVFMSALTVFPLASNISVSAESTEERIEIESKGGTVSPNVWYNAPVTQGNTSDGSCRYIRYYDKSGETEVRHYFTGNKRIWVGNTWRDINWVYKGGHGFDSVQAYNSPISTTSPAGYYTIEHEAYIHAGTLNTSNIITRYYDYSYY